MSILPVSVEPLKSLLTILEDVIRPFSKRISVWTTGRITTASNGASSLSLETGFSCWPGIHAVRTALQPVQEDLLHSMARGIRRRRIRGQIAYHFCEML